MNNKLAIIIGAGPGIGYSVAEKFGSEGFTIALISRSASKLSELSDKLTKHGISNHGFEGDASDYHSLKKALGEVQDKLGDAEFIHFNAYRMLNKDLFSAEWDKVKDSFDTNVGGFYNLLQLELPGMMERNRGKIIATGGGFALEPHANFVALSMGKAALRNLVQNAYQAAAKTRVHVGTVTVCGFVNPKDSKYNPGSISEEIWNLYDQEPDGYSVEKVY